MSDKLESNATKGFKSTVRLQGRTKGSSKINLLTLKQKQLYSIKIFYKKKKLKLIFLFLLIQLIAFDYYVHCE